MDREPIRADDSPMLDKLKPLVVLGLILALAWTLGKDLPTRVGDLSAQTPAPVPWGDYPVGLENDINMLAARADCDGLTDQRRHAEDTSASVHQRTGHTNSELLAYINDVMHDIGCYPY